MKPKPITCPHCGAGGGDTLDKNQMWALRDYIAYEAENAFNKSQQALCEINLISELSRKDGCLELEKSHSYYKAQHQALSDTYKKIREVQGGA